MYKNNITETETTGRRYVPPMMRVVWYHLDEEMAQTTPQMTDSSADDLDDKVKEYRDDLDVEYEDTVVLVSGNLWDKAW